jgi:hypothetical protein
MWQSLRSRYCPPLDDALFNAISSDYDVDDADSRRTFLTALELLKQDALQEENAEFDPSGTGGVTAAQDPNQSPESQSRSTPEENSRSNGVTSITTGLSEAKWDAGTELSDGSEHLSLEEKEDFLKSTFPSIHQHEISQILKKCAGVVGLAVDQLLSISFLGTDYKDDGIITSPTPRGIEAFAEENGNRKRKGRGKKKARTNESSRASSTRSFSPDSQSSTPNVWASLAKDVKFICTRTTLQAQAVKSVYHAEGADLSATIRALAVKESSVYRTLQDLNPLLQTQIIDLKTDFPTVPESQLFGLLILTQSIPSAAQELAEVMVTVTEPVLKGKLHGVAQYVPLDLSDNHPEASLSPPSSQIDYTNIRAAAAAHNSAASTAFSQASAAHRRGRSDHLMSGAATYYALEGHRRAKAAKDLAAAAAEARVSASSTTTFIDLHGVSIADAVRIAKDRTEKWWEGLGDSRYTPRGGAPGRAGFRIVTGVGRHSKNGSPRIGPAVSKMLINEGWKVVVEQGEVVVYGKARR